MLRGAQPNQLYRFSNLATQTMFAPCGESGQPQCITIGCWVLRGQLWDGSKWNLVSAAKIWRTLLFWPPQRLSPLKAMARSVATPLPPLWLECHLTLSLACQSVSAEIHHAPHSGIPHHCSIARLFPRQRQEERHFVNSTVCYGHLIAVFRVNDYLGTVSEQLNSRKTETWNKLF